MPIGRELQLLKVSIYIIRRKPNVILVVTFNSFELVLISLGRIERVFVCHMHHRVVITVRPINYVYMYSDIYLDISSHYNYLVGPLRLHL